MEGSARVTTLPSKGVMKEPKVATIRATRFDVWEKVSGVSCTILR
jgi:hypothetical protein